jgi:hypothetical protein
MSEETSEDAEETNPRVQEAWRLFLSVHPQFAHRDRDDEDASTAFGRWADELQARVSRYNAEVARFNHKVREFHQRVAAEAADLADEAQQLKARGARLASDNPSALLDHQEDGIL